MGILAMLAFSLIMLLSIVQCIVHFRVAAKEFKIYHLSILIALVVWLINQFASGDSLTYMQPVESTLFFYAVIGMVVGQQVGQKDASLSTMDRVQGQPSCTTLPG